MTQLSILEETLQILNNARAKHDAVLVSFSGGKDSLVTLDLCQRVFQRVECFFMQWVPGIAAVEDPVISACEERGVKLHMVPHWAVFRCLQAGLYCFSPIERDTWPKIKIRDIYATLIRDAGINLIAVGGKRTDSLWRKRYLDSTKGWDEVINPIVAWSKYEVVAYLKTRGIAIPSGDSGDGAGLDLSRPAVLWLHDNHPDDFAVLEASFPFVGAIVKHREIYGG